MVTALRHRDRVKNLICVDIAPAVYSSMSGDSIDVLNAMSKVDLSVVRSRSDADKQLQSLMKNDTLRAFMLQNLIIPQHQSAPLHQQHFAPQHQSQHNHHHHHHQPQLQPYWRVNIKALQNGGMDQLRGFPAEFSSSASTTQVFNKKTLFLSGETSNYIRKPEHFEAINRLFPSSQVTTISKSGHWIHAENPSEFVAVVAAFLKQVLM
jgi:esterase